MIDLNQPMGYYDVLMGYDWDTGCRNIAVVIPKMTEVWKPGY
jgi:hypothetical protein